MTSARARLPELSAVSPTRAAPAGIIWDNTSTQVQASSVYFSTLGTNVSTGGCSGNIHCAVKLTQLGLN
jgi:hypothetical protein